MRLLFFIIIALYIIEIIGIITYFNYY